MPASATILQFVGTFGVWILADRIGLSAIITIVVYAMTIARTAPRDTPASNRVSSYSVWETAVFVLNVLAFVMMGLQARPILERLSGGDMAGALLFAGAVLLTVIVVRLAWVLGCGALIRSFGSGDREAPGEAEGFGGDLLIGWCGMRGLVTLATAFALAARLSRPRSDRACRLLRGARHAGAAGHDAEAAACSCCSSSPIARSRRKCRAPASRSCRRRWTASTGKTSSAAAAVRDAICSGPQNRGKP